MEASGNVLSDLFERIRAWIPHKPEPVAREFWMPDRNCRLCYECEVSFTIFNRRHHCRRCGKVFCGNCSVNTIPVSDANAADEEGPEHRVRVCNYCYKVFTQGSADAPHLPQLHADSQDPPITAIASDELDLYSDGISAPLTMAHRPIKVDYPPLSTPATSGNRSDDDDDTDIKENDFDHHPRYRQRPDRSGLQGEEFEDDSVIDLELTDNQHASLSHKFDSSRSFDGSPLPPDDGDGRVSRTEDGPTKSGHAQLLSGDPPSQPGFFEVYNSEGLKPVDFENNALLWDPPPPEEEDTAMVDEEDVEDEDDEGGWGVPPSEVSVSSSEFKVREKAALRSLVGGHFRALVAKLLEGAGLEVPEEEVDPDSWLSIVSSLSMEAASLVKPDKGGGAMDPGNYVKVKCLASGHRRDSFVVKGVVCKKNVHNKRMSSRYKNPRILLLGGALEYQRVSNQLSSIETLLQQEIAHIKMTVDRIEQHHPNVLLVEKTVSGHAQSLLLNKDISLVLNVKKCVMDRIARCTGSQVFQSCESLNIPKAGHCGHCEWFHVEKYVEEHGSAGCAGEKKSKTLMFFEECPRPVGCTVLLQGANGDVLKKVKAVVQYAVFAAYHLALETSFLADEGATLPDCAFNQAVSVALPNTQGAADRSISAVPGFNSQTPTADDHSRSMASGSSMSVSPLPQGFPGTASTWSTVLPSAASSQISSVVNTPDTSPAHTTIGFSSTVIKTAVMSSPSAGNPNNNNGIRTGSLPRQPSHGVSGLSASLRQNAQENGHSPLAVTFISQGSGMPRSEALVSSMANGSYGTSVVSDGSHFPYHSASVVDQISVPNGVSGEHALVSHDEQMPQVDPSSNWQVEDQDSKEDFPPSPSDHQSILVSMSSRCLQKGTVCERAHLFRIKYYGNSDKPLGRYLRESLFDTSNCQSCEEPLDAHIHCFTHRQGSLTISVRRFQTNPALPGETEGKIWMWHRCLKCPRVDGLPPAGRCRVMSDAAWGLSFGKFLELSFSNHAAASRVAACGHSLHRDCLRFYGFGNAVACFRYAPIILNAVHVPPARLDFNNPSPATTKWLQDELEEIGKRGDQVFAEVFDTLRVIGERIANSGSLERLCGVKAPEARRRYIELETLAQSHKASFEGELQKAGNPNPTPGQPVADILQLNLIRRTLVECATYWEEQFNQLYSHLRAKRGQGGSEANLDDSSLKLSKQMSFGGISGKSTGSQDGEADSEGSGSALSRSHSGADSNGNSGTARNLMNGDEHLEMSADLGAGAVQVPPDMASATFLPISGDSKPPPVTIPLNPASTTEAFGSPVLALDEKVKEMWNPGIDHVVQGGVEDASRIQDEPRGSSVEVIEQESEPANEILHLDVPGNANAPDYLRAQGVLDDLITSNSLPAASSEFLVTGGQPAEIEQSMSYDRSGVLTGGPGLDGAIPAVASLNVEQKDVIDAVQQSAPSSPSKSVADRESATPFHSLYRTYSNRTSSSIAGSPPRNETRGPPSLLSISKTAAEGTARVLLPPGQDDLIIPIYDDEPTSIIAHALASEDYHKDLKNCRESADSSVQDGSFSHPLQSSEGLPDNLDRSFSSKESASGDPHILTQFEDGIGPNKMKYSVRSYYAKQFAILRQKCCDGDLSFLRSLCRCKKWGAQGGKSNVFFAKTADDRFVVKQVTRTESVSFRDFALEYFNYLSEYIDSGSPTCLAKIFGLYQVTVKKAGKEIQKMDLLVMENLLYGRSVSRIYDLKGSVRSRYNDSKGSNAVLLDQNLLESMPTAPIFVGNKAKRLLERAVWNDTAFLATVDVMDYSLLVGIDEERQELAIGIIDFIRQYTWDKQLETWVKASGILGGPKNAAPTVISPKQYKKRFRKAMSTYFLMVPDQCWSPPPIISVPPALEDNGRLSHDDFGEDGPRRS